MLDRDLVKTTYLVVVKVLEARELKGETMSVNPYVKITCGNLEPQQTKTIEKTSYAIWNQSFTFSDLHMNKWELETFELNFEVHDQYRWLSNSLIGSYSIGMSTMFRYPNSDIYKKWLRLSKPEAPTVAVGYIQVSCFIVGPGQEPPVHDAGDMDGDVEPEQEQMLRDGISPDVIFEQQKLKQGLWIIEVPSQNWINYQLMVQIYKGESFVKLSDEDTNPNTFLSVRSQGVTRVTRVVKNQDKPNYSQKIYIPVYVPTWNEKIKVVCWHQDGEYMPNDVFMANLPECPSAVDVMNIAILNSKEGRMEPTWFNMYGVRPKEWRSGMSRLHASAFMGRVLMSLHLIQNDRPVLSTSAGNSVNTLKTATYKLWIDVYELVNCDELIKIQSKYSKITMQAYLNGKSTEKSKSKVDVDANTLKFEVESVKEEEHVLPADSNQIPDIFININLTTYEPPVENKKGKKEEAEVVSNNDRLGFVRIPGKSIIISQEQTRPQWHVVTSITNRKKNIGRLLINCRLKPQSASIRRAQMQDSKDVQYWFFPQIFSGFELAPNFPEEDLVTFLKLNIGTPQKEKKGAPAKDRKQLDNQPKSEIKLAPVKGRFPTFGGSGYIKKPYKVMLNDEASFAKDMRVQLFQNVSSKFSGSSQLMLGSFMVPISTMCDKLYKRPQYYTVLDSDGNCQGKILARFFLMKRGQDGNEERNKESIFNYMQRIIQEIHTVDIKVSVLGLRQLLNLTKNAVMRVNLTNMSTDHGITAQSAYNDAIKNQASKRGDGSDAESEDDEEKAKKAKSAEAVTWVRKDQYYRIKMMKSLEDKATRNPNFGRYFAFEKVKLKRDMLLWPNLVIRVYENGEEQPPSHHLVLPTFLFADFLVDNNSTSITDVKISLALMKHTSNLESQSQQNPLMIYKEMMHEQLMNPQSDQMHYMFSLKLPQTKDEVFIELAQGAPEDVDELDEVVDLFKFDDLQELPLTHQEHFDDLGHVAGAVKTKGKQGDDGGDKNKANADEGVDSDESAGFDDDEFTDMGQLWQNFKSKGTMKGDKKGSTVATKQTKKEVVNEDEEGEEGDEDEDEEIEADDPVQEKFELDVVCLDSHKDKEKADKAARQEEMRMLLDKLRKISDSLDKANGDFKEQIRFQMMNARNRIEELEGPQMVETQFEAHLMKEETEVFDYLGRGISRKPLEAELNLDLPYFPLRLLQNEFGMLSTTENYSNHNFIFSTGKPVDTRVLLAVSIQRIKGSQVREGGLDESQATEEDLPTDANMDSDEEDNDTPSDPNPLGSNSNLLFRSIEQVEQQQDLERELWWKIKDKTTSVDDNRRELLKNGFEFDMFRPETLEKMTEQVDYTMRIFVKSAQNLTAVDNKVRAIRNRLAGDKALSSADPYLIMRIMGEEENEFYNGYEQVQEETLDPQFFTQYEEAGLNLQEDWRLEVEVRDQASMKSLDTIIGHTTIDLEQRRWSNRYAQIKLMIYLEQLKVQQQIEDLRNQSAMQKKKDPALKALQDAINKYLKNKLSKVKEIALAFAKKEVPQTMVEYRPIKARGSDGAPQGVLELFVDVLDPAEIRITPQQKLMDVTSDEKFEVRLIIWETREVPPPNGSVMSAQIRASYERTGLMDEPDIQETDVHAGCKDGRAIFNWRMKFEVGNDEFPRLKMQIFDTGLAGAEAVGETTLNLSTSIKLLKKSGTLEDKKIWVQFGTPTEATAGFCLIQLQIYYKEDAENDPVGQAQDEPNHNPVLKKPTVGRGWGDTLSGLGLGLPSIELPDFFGLIKKVIMAALIAMALFFVMFLILASK